MIRVDTVHDFDDYIGTRVVVQEVRLDEGRVDEVALVVNGTSVTLDPVEARRLGAALVDAGDRAQRGRRS